MRVRHIFKMEKLEYEWLSSTSVRKVMFPKEIHEEFMETLGKASLSYSTVKKIGNRV